MSHDVPRDHRPSRETPFLLEILLQAAGERPGPARDLSDPPWAAIHAELEILAAAGRRRLDEAPEAPESLGELGSLFVDSQRLAEMTHREPRSNAIEDPEALAAAVTAIEQYLYPPPQPSRSDLGSDLGSESRSEPRSEPRPTPPPPGKTAPKQGVRLEELAAEDRERLLREAAAEAAERLTASLLELDPATLVETPFSMAGTATFGTAAFGSGAIRGSVDEVAAMLRQLVGPDILTQDVSPPRDPRVARLTSELRRAVG